MANKLFKLLDPQQPSTSGTDLPYLTDWNKCVLCQEDTAETLSCPADSTRSTGSGYKTLADNLHSFSQIGCLPKSLDMSRLDEGDGIQSTFQNHKAKWHDSCRLKYNKTALQRAQKRKMSTTEDTTSASRKYTRQTVDAQTLPEKCFFCDKPSGTDSLRKASTFDLDKHVRTAALKLGDKAILAKLSAGDLIAQDAQYHVKCLVSLYNKARATKTTVDEQDDVNHGIALGELVSYIDDARMNDLVAPVFKLVDLSKLYTTRMEQLGTIMTGRVHSTKLKDRIMTYFPDLEEHKSGRDVLLAFNENIGSALKKACYQDTDNDGVCLARAANIVRRDMLKLKTTFSGSFEPHCQEQSVPTSLVALVGMILNGPNIEEQSSQSSVSTPTLTISQLLMFNCYTRRRGSTSSIESTRHNSNRETPLPVYLGTLMHTKTRKRDLVDTLFHLGLSISYDRVLGISTYLGDKVCRFFQKEGTVCPPVLKSGLFTTGAVDNIDHNPSSTSAQDSFHGTGISLFQHPSSNSHGVQREVSDETATGAAHLPQSYTMVPPVILGRGDIPIPKLEGSNKSDCQLIPEALQDEFSWLEQMEKTVASDTVLQEDDTVSWAAYHASKQSIPEEPESSVALNSLLPLFYDQAKSVAMIRHSMDVIKRAVDILNPGQIPVITLDQPLYTLAKQIQWRWPETHGEDYFVIVFGGLHIEMAAWKAVGDLLDGSGWTGVLVLAGVATAGTADSFLKASHVTRTRRAHQVTACSLYLLMKEAHKQYTSELTEGQDPKPLDDWNTERVEASPQFQFWFIILQLELTVLIYVRRKFSAVY
ncbi:uncharacterized protein LOC134266937 [Saccostrea cucullata]|uniref:uncharacterized protein LOC134266937 n=1 Tax=Saccostrea cuccullata TaxID=36930 RepID=UPI002ED1E9F6